MTRLILASTSSARKLILEKAGLSFDAIPPRIDEDALKQALLSEAVSPRDMADALAEAKAVKLSLKFPEALVIGADQMLAFDDGTMLDKPDSPETAKAQLALMSGSHHRLFSAAVIAKGGAPLWRHVGIVRMSVRPLSSAFIDDYVDRNWDAIRYCVGCYQIENEGAQLFSRIEGDHFDIMGLPLLPLLAFLRERKEIAS
ncbi:septum formation protein Maf [Sphingorhabdus pulchriflava]|uniref:Nucleoside triphosphate pyrophosphatase n=1 Tax=Sphingorhabdus pulchriflava TaxID=2292257 RepID=A0A371B4J4_9SPHN|nr:Maf family protein [Sphingorhabdus pulchriflava]RDV02509.1 septum formation protein Maf [Sphingorhabdus pulchriflava]